MNGAARLEQGFLFCLAAFFGLVIVVAVTISPKIALVLVPGMVIGSLVGFHPFVGLLILVFLSQNDAISNLASNVLPMSLFKLLSGATLFGFLLVTYNKPRGDGAIARLPEVKYIIMFVCVLIVSALWSEHLGAGLDRVINFLSVILLFFLIVAMTDTDEKLDKILWTLVLSGLFSATVVLLESVLGIRLFSTKAAAATAKFAGEARSAGASDFNPTTASHMMLATTLIAAMKLMYDDKYKMLSGLAFVLGTMALVLTLSRSATIAFLIVGLIFAWRERAHRFAPIILISGLALGACALPFVPEIYWERLSTIFDFGTDRTLFRRISYNLIGLQLWFQHPIIGIGPGNFPEYYVSQDFRWYPGRVPVPRQLHNSYLELAAETGTVGLALFLGVMITALRKAKAVMRSNIEWVRAWGYQLWYPFGAYMIASIFMPNEDTKFFWLLPAVCIVIFIRAQKAGHTNEVPS